MTHYLRVLLMLCCLLALPLIVSAQGNTMLDLGDGYSITLPDGWELTGEEETFVSLESDAVSLILTLPPVIENAGVNFPVGTNVINVLIDLTTLLDGVQIERSAVEKLSFDGRTAAANSTITDGIETRRIALTLNNGKFALLTFIATESDLEANSAKIASIIASLDAAAGSSTGSTSSTSRGDCTVSTDTANSAELRVGPGTNRGVISFLPANTDVSATGRIELADGSVWYQLDKSEAAPNGTPASELWVWEDQVTLNGDCTNVGATNAPPVIRAAPQVIAPPPAGDSGGSTTPSTPVPGLLQPRNGVYTLTLAPVINASCVGGQNVPLNTAELYAGEINYTYYVEVVDANSFYFGEDLYRRYPGSNSFDGIFTYEGGEQSSARIDVLSATLLHGEVNDLFPINDAMCSATLLFNATRN